jgi:hypothetical protein
MTPTTAVANATRLTMTGTERIFANNARLLKPAASGQWRSRRGRLIQGAPNSRQLDQRKLRDTHERLPCWLIAENAA